MELKIFDKDHLFEQNGVSWRYNLETQLKNAERMFCVPLSYEHQAQTVGIGACYNFKLKDDGLYSAFTVLPGIADVLDLSKQQVSAEVRGYLSDIPSPYLYEDEWLYGVTLTKHPRDTNTKVII